MVVLAAIVLQAEAKRKRPDNVGQPDQAEAGGAKFDAETLSCRGDYWDFASQGPAVAIQTPRYPSYYPNRRRCSWDFFVPANANVSLVCEKFQVHRSDSFCIYDFNSDQSGCWYGNVNYAFTFPFSFETSSEENFISMSFRSGRRRNAPGFRYALSLRCLALV